jgi:pilus assembly protein CpaF
VVRTYAGWEPVPVDFASTDEQLAFRVNQAIASEGKQLGPLTPIVDAVLPDGSRLSAIGEPVTDKLVLVIRKHREAAFQLMDFVNTEVQVRQQVQTHEIPDYISNEVPGSLMSGPVAAYLHLCVLAGLNILIIGRTGVGKTSMLSALGRIIPENRRVLVLEDTRELNIRDTNCAYLTSVQKVLEGGVEVSMQKLLITALRQRPDHLILGEARGAEIYDLLNAMQTGHGGNLTSIHANSLADLPQRVNAMLFQAGANMDNERVCALIGTSFHVGIVLRQSLDDGRRYIQEIGEFTGEVEGGRPIIHPIALGGPERGFHLDLVAKESSFEEEFRSNGLSFSMCVP